MIKIKFEPTKNNVGCFIFNDLKDIRKDQINEIKITEQIWSYFFKNQNLNPKEYVDFSLILECRKYLC